MSGATRLFDIIEAYGQQPRSCMVAGKKNGEWVGYSTEEFVAATNGLSRALLAKGLQKGDRVALMSGNRPEWNMVDFACNQLGIAIVPLYPTLSAQDLAYILADSETKLAFASNAELAEKLDRALVDRHLQIEVFTLDPVAGKTCYTELLEIGHRASTDLKPYNDAVRPDDLLTLIYTSGTTGQPKGVLLTHENVLSNVQAIAPLMLDEITKALSFLPLCHIFERTVVYLYLFKRVEIHYAESLDNIVADINDVRPQIFATVPRVLEKVYDKVVEKGKALTGIKKALFFWALNLGHRYQEPPKNGFLYNMKLSVARKLIFSKWRAALGDNIGLIISGGAALQERLARVFWAADIKVLEGYGLTETSPVIAVNSHVETDVKFGTVGRTLANLDVRIAGDGEILVKGPSVTSGYYKNEAASREIFNADGYLQTGDIGEITPDGFLKITDRKKEMFKTAGGKYVAPQALENKLMEATVIAQVMVVGENQRFPAALIVPAFEELEKWCNHKGIPFGTREEAIGNPLVIDKFQREINRANNGFGHWEQVKKFRLLPREWTIDAGELTPKLSLKRKIILKKEEEAVREIYN